MYYFTSDYTEGCTPEILEALAATNFEQTGGYGIDPYCETAALLIKKECGRSDIDVHFMTGGTQTNLTIICAALRPLPRRLRYCTEPYQHARSRRDRTNRP